MKRLAIMGALLVLGAGCKGGSSSGASGIDGAAGNGGAGPAGPDAAPDLASSGDVTVATETGTTADSASGDVASPPPDAPSGARPQAMTWTLEPTGMSNASGALGGTSEMDIWAVGPNGEARHSTGDGQWTRKDIGGASLTGLRAFAPNDVWASGYINAVFHWDGSGQWDRQGLPSGAVFEDIWGSGPQDLYLVGSSLYRSKGDRSWTYEGVPAAQSQGMGIWGSGPNDIYIVDGLANILHSKGDGVWIKQKAAPMKGPGVAIWGSGPNDVYVLSGGMVQHSTGDGTWTPQTMATRPNEILDSIWGSGTSDIYIGTGDGNLFRSIGDGHWYSERILPISDTRLIDVGAIWGPNGNNVYLLTVGGTFHGRPTK
jgi:hypothetical protein